MVLKEGGQSIPASSLYLHTGKNQAGLEKRPENVDINIDNVGIRQRLCPTSRFCQTSFVFLSLSSFGST